MKKFIEKFFTEYSPSEYIRKILSGEIKGGEQASDNKDREVYLNSRGELILNLDHPKVQKKLANQIQAFSKVKLNS